MRRKPNIKFTPMDLEIRECPKCCALLFIYPTGHWPNHQVGDLPDWIEKTKCNYSGVSMRRRVAKAPASYIEKYRAERRNRHQ